jgi:ABC-type multidrug transport system fused ATPase/permease subunit
MSAKLRLEYLKALFSLPVSTLDTLPSGQASNTITTTSNTLQIGISEKLGIFIQFTALLVTSIIVAFTYSWSLTLVTSSVLLFIGIVYGTLIPIIVKMTKEMEFADEKAASIAGEVLGSIRMIVACGAEGRIAKRYSGWVEESRRRGLKISPYTGAQFAPLFFSVYATMALCFWFGFKLYLRNDINSVGTVRLSFLWVAIRIPSHSCPTIILYP